jgi:hypothetical protein
MLEPCCVRAGFSQYHLRRLWLRRPEVAATRCPSLQARQLRMALIYHCSSVVAVIERHI